MNVVIKEETVKRIQERLNRELSGTGFGAGPPGGGITELLDFCERMGIAVKIEGRD